MTRGLAVVAVVAGLGMATATPASAHEVVRHAAASVTEQPPSQKFGSLSGMVVSSGRPVAGACVTASPSRSQPGSPAGPERFTTTSVRGRYFFTGLLAGTYRLGFESCPTPGAATRPARGVTIAGQAPTRLESVVAGTLRPVARVSLPAKPVMFGRDGRESLSSLFGGRVTLATAAITSTTGSISGSVTSVDGTPLSGICAVAVTAGGRGFQSRTGAAGAYEIKGLAAGGYYVMFAPGCGTDANWIGTSYADKSLVNVTTGLDAKDIDGHLQEGSSISGTVTNQKGSGLKLVCVTAISVTASSLSIYEELGLGHGGSYDFSGLTPGPYTVSFLGCGQNVAPQWWNGQTQFQHASVIRIVAGKSATGINAVLPRGGTITGRVTNSSGKALAGICAGVTIQLQKDVTESIAYASGENGNYSIPSLGTGSYDPQFTTGCPSEGNYAPTNDPATVAVVAGMTTSGADVTMTPGATISGTVTGPHGHGVGGICVAIGSTNELTFIFPVATMSNGNYVFKGLPAGGYELEFTPGCPNMGNYISQFYDNQISYADAALVTLTTGGTARGIDASLQTGGTISGTLRDANGHLVAGACVEAYSVSGDVLAGAQTGLNSEYEIEGLPTDAYYVYIDPTCGGEQSSSSAAIYYGGGNVFPTLEVSVTAGEPTADIDASLPEAGAIAGTVKPVSGEIFGCLYLLGTGGSLLDQIFLELSPNGSYEVDGLLPGRYLVAYSSCSAGGKTAPDFYPNRQSLRGATPITVTAGSTLSGIDFDLQKTAEITGHVSRPGGAPAPACVFADEKSASGHVDDTVALTNRKGDYVVSGIGTGTYVIEFGVCGEPPGAAAVRSAPVSVTDGTKVTGVDATLAVAGFVSGTVTSTTGAPLGGVCVQAGGLSDSVAVTSIDGTYELAGLPTGEVTISFFPDCGIDGTWSTARTPTPVQVVGGELTPGINAKLAPGGSITGTVTDSVGNPASEVCVLAVGTKAGEPTEVATTKSDGSYSIAGLSRGKYDVEFTNGCGNPTNFATQWWDDAGSQADATIVAVPSGSVETGIDAELTLAP